MTVDLHREIDYGNRYPVAVVDPLQQFLSTYVSPNFGLSLANPTTLQVVAGTGVDAVAIAIQGKWRFIDATTQRTHPGGGAGQYDVYVVTGDNVYTPTGLVPPDPPETDATDYTFSLRIVLAGGAAPSGAGIVWVRKIAQVTWTGTAISGITPVAFGVTAHAPSHAPGSTDPIDYSKVLMIGTLAARPTAAASPYLFYRASDVNGGTLYQSNGTAWSQAAPGVTELTQDYSQIATAILLSGTIGARPTAVGANTGFWYFASDQQGGTLYQSNGAAWQQRTKGLTELPNAHASTHAPGGADALPWTTIHGVGTLAARPAAASANSGYFYFATDDTGGTLYESNGTTWDARARGLTALPNAHASTHAAGGSDAFPWTTIHGRGVLASRPTAAAGNAGYFYTATDVNGGTLYESDGSAWSQIAYGVTQVPSNNTIAQAILLIGTLAARPAAASGNQGFWYSTTDTRQTYRSDGSTWANIGAVPPGSAAGADSGTAFPSSGLFTGYRFTLQMTDGDGTSAVMIDCVYRPDLDSTYPWHVVGSPFLFDENDTNIATTSTAYTDRHSVAVTPTRAGVYDFEYGGTVSAPGNPTGGEAFFHPQSTSISPTDAAAAVGGNPGSADQTSGVTVIIATLYAAIAKKRFTLAGANETVAVQTKTNGVRSTGMSRVFLRAYPRRLV